MKLPIALDDRTLGIIQLAIGITCVLLAVSLTWSSITRWGGINDIKAAQRAIAGKDQGAARTFAQSAAMALPDQAAANLLDLDLAIGGHSERLRSLLTRVPKAQRSVVDTALQLNLALNGKPVAIDGLDQADAAFIKSIAAMRADNRPAPLPSTAGSAPYRTVVACAYQELLRTAWLVRDAGQVRSAAGAMLLLDPAHPQRDELRLITAALDPDTKDGELIRLGQLLKDENRRTRLANILQDLAPGRSNIMTAVALGADPRTIDQKQVLAARIERVLAGGFSLNDLDLLFLQSLDLGAFDSANKVAARMQDPRRLIAGRELINREGDLAKAMSMNQLVLSPRMGRVRAGDRWMAFHLSNDSGMLPRSTPQILVDGKPVEGQRVQRFGSLFVISGLPKGLLPVSITVNDKPLFNDRVNL